MCAQRVFLFLLASTPVVWTTTALAKEPTRPNILLLTVDDMSCDSVGVFGCKLEGTTPNIDRLARNGLRFQHAYVQVGNCMPCRNVLMSGRYPHNNGVEGFRQVKGAKYPILVDLMRDAGYFTGIFHKVGHSTPYSPYVWDLVMGEADGERLNVKDPKSYYLATKAGLLAAEDANKPFCLVINISDPHKPFYGERKKDDDPQPSQVYKASDIPIPGFLFDHPMVRKELAMYYSSVRRADDCLGETLKALKESGAEDDTVIVFLSDHGMPLPFAKTQVYYHSLRTPLIVSWPGVTKADCVDETHMVSVVDLLPTLLDVVGVDHPDGLDGRSFAPLLTGKSQEDRDFIIGEYNENAGGNRHPMRTVITRKYGYIFNPWSDGVNRFRTATQGTATYRVMQTLAETDPKIAARLDLFDHRVVEEFYDYERDPDALTNLIDDPACEELVEQARGRLSAWMQATGDHCLAPFTNRDDPESLRKYMEQQNAITAGSRKNRSPKKRAK